MALAYKYSIHGIAWRSAPFREESKSKSATPRKHPGFKAHKGSGQGSPGQGRRGQGTGLCRHLSKLTRCSPYPCQPPFSTFRSPVESRLQISDSKLVLIITKYAYVQRNPANGLGAREIWLLDCHGAPLHHRLCLGICPLGRRPGRWRCRLTRSIHSLAHRAPAHTLSWLADMARAPDAAVGLY